MSQETFKVGELAQRTGLTTRTLHHYDDIGLLNPSLHTGSGHRLYTADDLARLQQILSLRQLGLSLQEIGECLDRPEFSPLETIRRHLARLREQMALQQSLCERMEAIAAHFRDAETVSPDEFLQTIQVMTMFENYYTPEQLETLKKRRDEVGEERMQQAPHDWEELYAAFRTEMERGTDPADPNVRELARRHQSLVNEFTGGDSGIAQSLERLWKEQSPTLAAQFGTEHDPELMEYTNRALAAVRGDQ